MDSNWHFDAGERQKRWFFYSQDTYRITRKLTMNYGLRWEIYFPQSVTGKGAGGSVDLNTGLVSAAGYGDVNLQGNVKNSFHNFAPRLGIAYQVTPKTVVRLGYGRSFGGHSGRDIPRIPQSSRSVWCKTLKPEYSQRRGPGRPGRSRDWSINSHRFGGSDGGGGDFFFTI